MRKFNKDKYLKKLKIKQFFRNNLKYFYVALPCFFCGFLGIYFTYSKFFTSEEQEIIRTTVGDFSRGDVILTVYVDGKKVSKAPQKNTGYIFKTADCNNDATFTWTNSNWKFLVNNITKKTKCNIYFEPGEIYEYAYTGAEQEFTVEKAGIYKIETWGAQGGGNGIYIGGYGGYATGEIQLNIGEKLYINVGGHGGSNLAASNKGGYNGGGYSGNDSKRRSFGGGGATHVAYITGTLANIDSSKLYNILEVAAGGGGATNGSMTQGGHGGGYIGVDGSTTDSDYTGSDYLTGGGTQTSAGTAYEESKRQGKFGTAQTSNTTGWGGGGGGGLYGGSNGRGTTGAGGSGYIGNDLLINKAMYCYNCEESDETATKTISTTCSAEEPTQGCTKKGDGYVIITLESETSQNVYDYTGDEQTYIAAESGIYKIEVWGAQGGSYNTTYYGGYGGYSTGYINLEKNDKLYINVGGKGNYVGALNVGQGGYNGGGSILIKHTDSNEKRSTGGGATHIAKISGLLSTLENNKDDILIVTGGGGAAQVNSAIVNQGWGLGGHGGGISGTTGTGENYNNNNVLGPGGTQTGCEVGNSYSTAGTFGQGGQHPTSGNSSGGGGGYYGGASSLRGAGGGSGYIGNSLLSNKAMYCYNCEESNEIDTKTISITCSEENPTTNCAKKGNGYARVTYIPINIKYYIDNNEQESIPDKSKYSLKSIVCEKSSDITWNNESWNVKINSYQTKDTCNIYFKDSNINKSETE